MQRQVKAVETAFLSAVGELERVVKWKEATVLIDRRRRQAAVLMMAGAMIELMDCSPIPITQESPAPVATGDRAGLLGENQ